MQNKSCVYKHINFNYKFAIELIIMLFTDIVRKSVEAELIYKVNCKRNHMS